MDLRKGFHEPAEKPRRFYKAVTVDAVDGGFGLLLDGRRLRTPKAQPLVLPTRAAVDRIHGHGPVEPPRLLGRLVEAFTQVQARLPTEPLRRGVEWA